MPLGYLEFVDNVAFSSDGRYVMATGHDATAMVWDAATGETLVELRTPPVLLRNSKGFFAWSPDARRLVVAGEAYIKDLYTVDLVVRVQDLGPVARSVAELASIAQLMAGRKLDESGTFVSLTSAELAAISIRREGLSRASRTDVSPAIPQEED